jgi:nicotinamidase-related amidase
MTLTPSRTALVVVDMVPFLVAENEYTFGTGMGGQGPLRSRLWHEFEVHDADLLVEKTAPSAVFPGHSPLPEILPESGIDTVLITGTGTNVCCESSARVTTAPAAVRQANIRIGRR